MHTRIKAAEIASKPLRNFSMAEVVGLDMHPKEGKHPCAVRLVQSPLGGTFKFLDRQTLKLEPGGLGELLGPVIMKISIITLPRGIR